MTTLTPHEYLVKALTDRFWLERECQDLSCEACDSDDPSACKNLARAAVAEMTRFGLQVVPKFDNAIILAIHDGVKTELTEAVSTWDAALAAAPDYAGIK